MPLIDVSYCKTSKYPIDIRTPDGQVGLEIEEAEQLITDLVQALKHAYKAKYENEYAESFRKQVPVSYPTIFLRKVA